MQNNVESHTQGPEPHTALRTALTTAAGYLALFYLALLLPNVPAVASALRTKALGYPAAVVSLAAFTLVQLLLVRYVAAITPPARIALAGSVVCLVLWILLPLTTRVMPSGLAFYIFFPWQNMLMILAAVLFGCLVSLAIREPGILFPGALVAGMVDYWGVYHGTTMYFIQAAPNVVSAVSVKMPAVSLAVPMPPSIGPGDFVFLGVFFAALYRLRMRVSTTFWLFLALLVPSLVVVLVLGIDIPALVPMAVAMVLANFGEMRLSRSEMFATLYVVLAVAGLLAVLTLVNPFRGTARQPQHPARPPAHSAPGSRP